MRNYLLGSKMSNENSVQKDILKQYADGPELVAKSIEGLSAEQLDLKLTADSWSIRQLVHHISDGDYLWKEFLLRAMGDEEKEFSLEWYWCLPQDEWTKRWAYARRDISLSLELLQANRRHTMELLMQVPGLWDKRLKIPKPQGGYENACVGEVVAMQAGHVEGHVEDIWQVRQKHGV
jgi:hypothetical protein